MGKFDTLLQGIHTCELKDFKRLLDALVSTCIAIDGAHGYGVAWKKFADCEEYTHKYKTY